jgi:PAS domain S-box-containing protein
MNNSIEDSQEKTEYNDMEKGSLLQFVNTMPVGFAKLKLFLDDQGQRTDAEFVFINQMIERTFDISSENIVGKSLNQLINSDHKKTAAWAATGIKSLKSPRNMPYHHHDNESNRDYKIVISRAEEDHVNALIIDFTDEILLERESIKLADSMKNFYAFFNSIYDMLFILDEQGNIIHANKTVFDRLGYSEEELYGNTVLKVHPENRRDEALSNVIEMLQGTREYCPVPLVAKDGSTIAVETRVKNGEWDGKSVLFGVCKDISELKTSEEKFSKAFHNSGALMAITRLTDAVFIDVNQAFCDNLGYTREEIIGNTSENLNLFKDPNPREKLVESLMLSHSLRNVEAIMITKNGSTITGLFNADLIYLENELCFMTSMIDISERILKEDKFKTYNKQLEGIVSVKVKEIAEAQLATITALSNITESRDTDTGSHVERLKEGCRIIAEKLSSNDDYKEIVTPDFISNLQYASVVHDIGKVGVKDSILLKPGKLTPEEFEEIKQHPVIGANVLKLVHKTYPGNAYIEMGIEIAESHHEKWDGTGYPYKLSGEKIPLSAQILAICDVYDALRSKRPYKEPMNHQDSLKELLLGKGKHFNPIIVDTFMICESDFEQVYLKLLETNK